MPPLLYLDTARLGPMSPAARDAQLDFVRLSAEEPSSLYFEQFLRDGFRTWPDSYQRRFPGLCTWSGIAGLKQAIRQLAGAPDEWQVLLANRSLSLVELAARAMFRVCRNVLATDLSWPTYQRAVETKAHQTANRVTVVPLRDDILYRAWTVDDVATYLTDAFITHQCDGIFLPAVDHLGIRLPIHRIVKAICRQHELRFCMIDAAQAFCHVSITECLNCADFIVAGSHKWMGGYLPTGIGLFGRRQSRSLIECLLRRRRHLRRLSDPMLNFVEQLDNSEIDGESETVNLTSLFTCAGAVSDYRSIPPGELTQRLTQIDSSLAAIPRPPGDWQPVRPVSDMRSRITLLRSEDRGSSPRRAEAVRKVWLSAGSIVSAFHNGVVRLSISRGAR